MFLYLAAALADLTAVVVHGVLGHRAVITPLTEARLFEAPMFGDANIVRRVIVFTYHAVTLVFLLSAIAICRHALGSHDDAGALRFIGAIHCAYVVVAVAIIGRRVLDAFRRPVPILF